MPKTREPENCAHYWKTQGEPHHRWWADHAMAKCLHCFSWTVVEYKAEDGIGPCKHSIGQHRGQPHFIGELPLEKEVVSEELPGVDPSYVDCPACIDRAARTPFGEEITLCTEHALWVEVK